MAKYKGVIFDLDGTIIESKEGIVDSLVYSLEKMGKEKIDRDLLKSYIGLTLEDIYIKELNTNDENIIRKAIDYYREDFEKNGVYKNTLYNGIKDFIISLYEEKIKIYIASIKPAKYTKLILEYHNLSMYFDYIVGSGMYGEHNTKYELIKMVIDYSNFSPNELIMIGDRKGDIEGAKKHNMDTIGVLYGYGTKEELMAVNPTYYSDILDESILSILLK